VLRNGTLFKKINLPTLLTKENMGFFIQRFSTKEKGKTQIYLIELMNERRKRL
jgi:hypothetical protein